MAYSVLEELVGMKSGAGDRDAAKILAGLFGGRGTDRSLRRWLRLIEDTTAKSDFNREAGLSVDRIKGVGCPALAVYGELSNCMPTCRGLEEHLPHCQTVILPGLGHLHPMIEPQLFAQHLQRFLASQPDEATRRRAAAR